MKKTGKKSLVKKKSLFDHIKQITNVQNPNYWEEISDEDKKSWSNYMTHRFLSMKIEWVELVNELQKYNLNYTLEWKLSGTPFLTDSGSLIDAATAAIKEIVGIDTICSTGGGTSDGRFIAPTGAETIELGVVNETIHKINECVKVDDLDTLSGIDEKVLEKLLSN